MTTRLRRLLLLLLTATLVGALTVAGTAQGARPAADPLTDAPRLGGDLQVHDPALVVGGPGRPWIVMSTGDPAIGGGGIRVHTSPNGTRWSEAGVVLETKPAWLTEAVPGVSNLWAPELVEHDGTWYLYYSASTFGSNRSVIGLLTNDDLDPRHPDRGWVDRGPVVASATTDDYNAIDPGIVVDADGTPWMALGSFWSGIRMVELQWPSGLAAPSDGPPLRLVDRREGVNAVEAPTVVPRDGWYYLFVSMDFCCQGVDSTYRTVVARSRSVTGPYVDQQGRPMLGTPTTPGGGTTLLSSAGTRIGPGGASYSDGVLAHHYYDATADGAPRLSLRTLTWGPDGWPTITAGR